MQSELQNQKVGECLDVPINWKFWTFVFLPFISYFEANQLTITMYLYLNILKNLYKQVLVRQHCLQNEYFYGYDLSKKNYYVCCFS